MATAFILILGISTAFIAGIMAYVITYNEYQHHFKGKRVAKESFRSGVVTFLFFLVLTLVLAIIIK